MVLSQFKSVVLTLLILSLKAYALPSQPTEATHPGSSAYDYQFERVDFKCGNRNVNAVLPVPRPQKKVPMIVFGHGQALDVSHYEEMFKHIAQKGFVAIHPQYDTGFFDQNWNRMGQDYLNLTKCAITKFSAEIDESKLVFSGHSKGAYVASIAAGLASQLASGLKPASVVLFATAGFDAKSAQNIPAETELTVVFGKSDSIVKDSFSRDLFDRAGSLNKQFILMKDYPASASSPGAKADHMFPLTKASTFGGGKPSALHFYGTWKWLVAAAQDVQNTGLGENAYLYGEQTTDKGVEGLTDSIERSQKQKIGSEYLVRLNSYADLREIDLLLDRKSKIQKTYEKLVDHANRSQKSLLNLLDQMGVEYRAFYIDNLVLVKNVNAAELSRIQKHADVQRTFQNTTNQLRLPEVELPLDVTSNDVQGNIKRIFADQVWQKYGVKGESIVVAGQDTGYDWEHPAIRRQYRGLVEGKIDHNYNWHDAIKSGSNSRCGVNARIPCDDDGHGTHTMGTIVGDDGGKNKIGVAPNAKWIGCRNMNAGVGTPATYIDCFEYFLAPYPVGGNPRTDGRTDLAPHVINNSWSCPKDEGCSGEEFLNVVAVLRNAGVAVVVSAGNEGPGCGTIAKPPGMYSGEILSIGSYNHWDHGISSFSSRGPSAWNKELAPDLVAPGHMIRSAIPRWSGSSNSYDYKAGTSMAGPHVAGAIALLWSAKPSLIGNVDATFDLLKRSSTGMTSSQSCGNFVGSKVPNVTFGYGLLNALKLIEMAEAEGY